MINLQTLLIDRHEKAEIRKEREAVLCKLTGAVFGGLFVLIIWLAYLAI